MKMNVGAIDRKVRITIGALAGILSLAILGNLVSLPELASPALGVVSLLMLVTGFTGFCPVYTLLGIKTGEASPR